METMPLSVFLFVSWSIINAKKKMFPWEVNYIMLFIYFESLFHGLSKMQGLPLNVHCIYLSSFAWEWTISRSRTLAYDHYCLSTSHRPPYLVGLLLNEWLVTFLGNVLLVAGPDPFNIIQCSIYTFLPRAVLFACKSESFWGRYCGLLWIILYTPQIINC